LALCKLFLAWKLTYSLSIDLNADHNGSFFLGTSALRAASRSEDKEGGRGGARPSDSLERERSVEAKLFKEVEEEFLDKRLRLSSLLFLVWRRPIGFWRNCGWASGSDSWFDAVEGGLATTGSGTVMEFAARIALFLPGDQLLSFFSFLDGDSDEGLEEEPAQDFRANDRNVPATERPRLFD
jgi:hypothetical protein